MKYLKKINSESEDGNSVTRENFQTKIIDRIPESPPPDRPFIILSFAQGLDGSIAIFPRERVRLSSLKAEIITHRLRASMDAILIGIGTLLSDNPLLTVRHVEGRDPRPIVVDSHLRIPLAAKLLRNKIKPWIAATHDVDTQKNQQLLDLGVKIIRLPATSNGWVNLKMLLKELSRLGVRRLMVEGGSQILTSFIEERLADQLIATIAPFLMGGVRAINGEHFLNDSPAGNIDNVQFFPVGSDLILTGDINWKK